MTDPSRSLPQHDAFVSAPRSALERLQERSHAALSLLIEVLSGPHQGRVFEFRRHESLVAGRAESCQLRLEDDPHVSRYHFRIEANPPAARISDLDSANGTLVNGTRTKVADLREGDEIVAGSTRLTVRFRTPMSDPDLEPTAIVPAERSPQRALSAAPLQEYELQEEVGRGALGIVHRAVHRSTGRIVAVKQFLTKKPLPALVAGRFLEEADALKALRHPRIVELLDVGVNEGRPFAVFEFIDRQTPEALWAGMKWERRVRVACGIACQTLEGLEFAHARGFVHGDLKPSNVLMLRTGRKLNVRLTDFGWARILQRAGCGDLTEERDPRRPLVFLAPEQVIDCRAAGPSCDVYAVGVALFQHLADASPFEFASERSGFAAILDREPARLDDVCPGVPQDLAALVQKALAKSPSDRFASAAEMRSALLPFLEKQ